MHFVVPAEYWVKLQEIEKKDKYLDLAWELKKTVANKVTIIPIVISALVKPRIAGFCGSNRPESKNETKWKDRQNT